MGRKGNLINKTNIPQHAAVRSIGIYFAKMDGGAAVVAAKSITINGYTGFPHSEHCGH